MHVSTTSWTSPRDSRIGLPISRVISCESASKFSSTSRPSCWIARPRTGAGTLAHAGWAAFARRHASRKVAASASFASTTVSSRWAGFAIVTVPLGAPSTGLPSRREVTARVEVMLEMMLPNALWA